MEQRILGKTNEKLSIIGFGGVVVAKEDQKDANYYVAEAIDNGVNYFDVAPTYFDAEEKLGLALEAKRNKIFLACKTEDRSKSGSEALLHQSLKKLKTDHFDLYQLHAMYTMEDVEKVFMPDGAMETFLNAKKNGLIRYIGFSAHSEEVAIALMNRYPFDSMLLPVNWVNIFISGFGVKALEKAEEIGIGRLAIKAMARTSLSEGAEKKYSKSWYEPIDDEKLASLALRYTLSKSITAAIPPGEAKLFKWALETAKNFKPITAEEEELLREMSKDVKPLFPL
jgi:predicted aldo/keto reductase-like oxidoreductase